TELSKKEWFYFICVIALYILAIWYVATHNLSWEAMFKAGILQKKGLSGLEARVKEIDTPLSWNIPLVIWYIIIKGAALLVELLPYWIIGMFIAGALVVFVSWEKVRHKMGYGGFGANFVATVAGSLIPICSCGIVPVLAGMVESGIPLGPTLAFLIAAPMLNVPTVFMTAGLLGKKMALARVISVFAIAMSVGLIVSYWQKKRKGLRHLIKIYVQPNLSPQIQKFAYSLAVKLMKNPDGLTLEEIGQENKEKLEELEESEIIEQTKDGKWRLIQRDTTKYQSGCMVLPQGYQGTFRQKLIQLWKVSWQLFFALNYYLVLAVLIAGCIRVLIPTSVIVNLVGGRALNSVLVASVVAILAYVCTYVEVPTALALIAKGMGPGATLAYLLGGPGLSLPSIIMLSAVFKPRLLWLYVGLSFIGCVIAGYIFNLF
ncbi:MAG: permease, partial [Candidatus Omnitrophica bacterium]|nr:permease [Candidatus Omnitrophota bacterium]